MDIRLLHIAARFGNRDCLEVLLKARGNGDIVIYNGSTPLHMAVNNNHPGCVEALVNASVNNNLYIKFSNITPYIFRSRKVLRNAQIC